MTTLGLLPILKVPIAATGPTLTLEQIRTEPLPSLIKQLWENRKDPKIYRKYLGYMIGGRNEEFLKSICGLQFDPKALLQILVDYHQGRKVQTLPDKTACLIQGGNICFTSLEFQFSPGEPAPADLFLRRSLDTDYPTLMRQSLPNCKTPKEIIRMLEDISQSRGRDKRGLIEEIAKRYWINSPEFALAFLKAVESEAPNPNLADAIKRANLLLSSIDTEPLSDLVKKLLESHTKPDYNQLLDRLHRRHEEFLKSVCGLKFDPKALLQILIDYHQRYKVENMTDKTACLIRGARVCFNSLRFQFPLGEPAPIALLTGEGLRGEYPTLMLQSLPYCRTPKEIIRMLWDLSQSYGRDKPAVIDEIVKKHWINSWEFAFAFLEAEHHTSHEPPMDEARMKAYKKAILLLVPKDSDPPAEFKLEGMDDALFLVISALHVVLMPFRNSKLDSTQRVGFLKSLARARPQWADYFCGRSRLFIGKKVNEPCW